MADKNQVLGRRGRVEREARYTKIVVYSSVAVVGSIILVLLVGLVNVGLIQPQQPIMEINGQEISTAYFQEQAKVTRYLLISQYVSTFNELNQFGQDNPEFVSQVISQYDQQFQLIEFQLLAQNVGQSTLDQIVENAVIREAAEEMGIVLSDEEVDQYLEESLGYYANGRPEAAAAVEIAPASTLSATQLAVITVTPTQVILAVEETEEEAAEPTATFETPPTATIMPTEEFGGLLETNVYGQFEELTNEDAALLRDFYVGEAYREAVFEAITADSPAEEEMVWAQHILLATEEEAWVLHEALQEGADWTEQVALLSLDQSNNFDGGNLGWFSQTRMVPEFANAAFAAEIGTITEPVQSDFGWHLIQILGHEPRTLNAQEYEQAQEAAFAAWLEEAKSGASITTYDYWVDRVPNTPAIPYQTQENVAYIRQQLANPLVP